MSNANFGRRSSDRTPTQRDGRITTGLRSIGLLGVPFDRAASIRGASLGPAALRIAGLADTLRALGHMVTDFGDVTVPSAQSPDLGSGRPLSMTDMSAWSTAIHDRVVDTLRQNYVPVTMGGDHSIAMGTVAAAQRYCLEMGKDLAVLWLDAHADFNTPETSPTGNMHGMPVAFLSGDQSLQPILATRGFHPLLPSRITLFGLRSIDREERRALKARGITSIDMRLIDEFGVSALLRDCLRKLDPEKTHLHVSFDLDLLDPGIAPGVGTPVLGGTSYREAHLIMELLFDSGMVGSVDVVELNPFVDTRGATAHIATEMIASLFGRTILEA